MKYKDNWEETKRKFSEAWNKISENYEHEANVFDNLQINLKYASEECPQIQYVHGEKPDENDECTFDIDEYKSAEKAAIKFKKLESESKEHNKKYTDARNIFKSKQNEAALSKKAPEYSNWSEGLNRHIDTIKVTSKIDGKLFSELKELSPKCGFKLEMIVSDGEWLEDYGVRRHDGKVLVLDKETPMLTDPTLCANMDNKSTPDFIGTLSPNEIVRGNSYLEGGNVLNTLKADGKPGAIIGDDSIRYTLEILKKSNLAYSCQILFRN